MPKLNKELAELYGIILGNGCISRYYCSNRERIEIRIDGNSLTDKEYYQYLQRLILKIIKKRIKIGFRKNVNGIYIKFTDRKLIDYFQNQLNFPIGKKGNIKI